MKRCCVVPPIMPLLQNNITRSKLFSIAKYILLLGIAFFLLVFAFRGINVNKVFSEIMNAKILWVLFSASFSVIALESGKHPILTTKSVEICSKMLQLCDLEKPFCCVGVCKHINFNDPERFGRCIKY